jgi:hypothetical protein
MTIYKTSDDLYLISDGANNRVITSGTCFLNYKGSVINIKHPLVDYPFVDGVDVTTIFSDSGGSNKYASLAAFLTAMKGFFA